MPLLSSDDMYLHFHATHTLGQLNHPETMRALLENLKSDDPNIRHGCTVALGRLGDKQAIEPIMGLVDDEETKVRYSVAYALGDLADSDDTDVTETLKKLLKDPDENVISAARDALGKLIL
jgi:HEAT repeat protein